MKSLILIVAGLAMIVLSTPIVTQAQWFRGDLKETLRRLEEDSDRFAKSLDNDLDHSAINGTRQEDEINRFVHEFEEATDRLKNRYDDRGTAPGFAREVLARGRNIDRFMRRNRTGPTSESDWRAVRQSLDRLAWVYRINWRW